MILRPLLYQSKVSLSKNKRYNQPMQRDLPAILGGLFLLVIVAIIMFSNNRNQGLSLTDSNSIPTSGILGATTTPQVIAQNTGTPTIPLLTLTPSLTPTPTITPSKTPSPTPPTPRATSTPPLEKLLSCSSVESKARVLATGFKTKHINKDYTVLSLISSPISPDDTNQLDYWLGTDIEAPRLYTTTPTTYSVLKFEPTGVLEDKGEDRENRGAKICQLTINERRKITSQDGSVTEDNITRYLEFSVTESEDIVLSGYKDVREGKKYSGFN